MEALLIVAGGATVIAALFVFAMAMGFAIVLWECWWLAPLWSTVLVPLGVPAITFWQLVALDIFLSVLLIPTRAQDYAKVEDKSERTIAQLMTLAVAFAKPVMAYYLIRWALA